MIDKVRIAKDLQASVEQWSQALDTTPAKFVNEALRFYIRHLQGYSLPVMVDKPINQQPTSVDTSQIVNDNTSTNDLDMDW